MFAVHEAYKAGLWAPKHWLSNAIAGVIVGVVALPLAMAFAIASGVKPEQGLYTAIIAGIVVALFGGSRIQIAGPTGAFIVILSGIVLEHGVAGLQIATLMAGVMLCAFGLSRMGGVIRYIPLPVILGFTAGIGVIIWVGQWQAFFGLPVVPPGHFHEKLWFLFSHLGHFDLITSVFGIVSLLLVLLPVWNKRLASIPGPLLALIVAGLAQYIFQFPSVATIGSAFGDLPSGLPMPALPEISLDKIISLIGPAFAIALLGAIESLLSAVVADNMANTRHDSNTELFGQGLANIISPLFGGIAATGAIARTATNIRSGGYAPLAGVVHSVVLVLILVFLAPMAKYIPLSCLAAILFVVAWNMSEVKRFRSIVLRAPKADVIILLATFLLTVFTDLVVAVNIGVVLSILHFLRRMAGSFNVVDIDPATLEIDTSDLNARLVRIQGPLFFAAIEPLNQLLSSAKKQNLIISLSQVPFADVTALQLLDEHLHKTDNHYKIILCDANDRVFNKLIRMGSVDTHSNNAYSQSLLQAVMLLKESK